MGFCPGLKFGSHSVSGFAGATDGRVAGAGGEVTVASVAFMCVWRKDLRAGVVRRLSGPVVCWGVLSSGG